MKSEQEAALNMIKELLNNSSEKKAPKDLKEGIVKEILKFYLDDLGWRTIIAWGNKQGIDVEAIKGTERWIIEAKGTGANKQSQDKSFNDLLGAIIQRMDDPKAKYSIALPDIEHFRDL